MNIVIIGSSTGGPKILPQILTGLPKLNASIILVQHMRSYINESFRKTLDRNTEMDVRIAEHGDVLNNGEIVIAPSGVHLEIANNKVINLSHGEKVHFVCPSIDVTMKSLRKEKGCTVMGIILTGMGCDGVDGITHIKSIGGMTIAQDEATSVIYGMPKAAYGTGHVDWVLTPMEIREKLLKHYRLWRPLDVSTHPSRNIDKDRRQEV